jgi:hypothetical protein
MDTSSVTCDKYALEVEDFMTTNGAGKFYRLFFFPKYGNTTETSYLNVLAPVDDVLLRLELATGKSIEQIVNTKEGLDILANHVSSRQFNPSGFPLFLADNGAKFGSNPMDLDKLNPSDTRQIGNMNIRVVQSGIMMPGQIDRLKKAMFLPSNVVWSGSFMDRWQKASIVVIGSAYKNSEYEKWSKIDPYYIGIGLATDPQVVHFTDSNIFDANWEIAPLFDTFFTLVRQTGKRFDSIWRDLAVCMSEALWREVRQRGVLTLTQDGSFNIDPTEYSDMLKFKRQYWMYDLDHPAKINVQFEHTTMEYVVLYPNWAKIADKPAWADSAL